MALLHDDPTDAVSFLNHIAGFQLPEEDFDFPEGGDLDDYIASLPDDRICGEFAVFADMIRMARDIVIRGGK